MLVLDVTDEERRASCADPRPPCGRVRTAHRRGRRGLHQLPSRPRSAQQQVAHVHLHLMVRLVVEQLEQQRQLASVLPNSARTPSGRPSPDVPSTSPGRSLAEQYGRPLPRGPLEPFQGISSGAVIYSCPYHTCTRPMLQPATCGKTPEQGAAGARRFARIPGRM